MPSLGISLAFHIDGLSALMLVLITGIGTCIFVYASGYLAREARRGRLLLVLLLFMLAMMGAVAADNLILLFVFWELTSLTSFLLIGFKHEKGDVRDAARQALLVTAGGGLALLAGALLLGQIAGTWSLSGIVAAGPTLVEDPLLPFALVLLLLGCFSKSALFPFHFWLPNAMSAPAPVSAYLHSATMVKLGIYLMARLDPAFNDIFLWRVLLIGAGSITAVWGAVGTLQQRDLKRMLAYSTISALGILTLLVGLPSPAAGLAVATFLFAHALYKAPLFMAAGNIEHAVGTRDVDHLKGLRRVMPWTALAALLAGLSMAGLPLSIGFVAKDAMASAKAGADAVLLVSVVIVLVNTVAIAVAGVLAIRVFWGKSRTPLGREVSWRMVVPPLAIVMLGIEFEIFPDIADPLLIAAARSIAPQLGPVELRASFDLGVVLSATGVTVMVGLLVFLLWDRLYRVLDRLRWLGRFGPTAAYEYLLLALSRVAALLTQRVQHGHLAGYVRSTLAALLVMGAGFWTLTETRMGLVTDWPPQAWAWSVSCLFVVAGVVAAVIVRNRLALLMASGLVGYGSATLFLFSGAPDLAMTQFAIETVLVVVAASVLPRFGATPKGHEPRRLSNLALAGAAGIGTFLLLANLTTLPVQSKLDSWFAQASLSQGHGRNVVNVIIVDFRALDTLGEIAVVAFSLVAAMPLLALLRRGRTP